LLKKPECNLDIQTLTGHTGARLDLHNNKGEDYGIIYLKHLINTETYEHKTCLTLAFKHRPKIYFLKEFLPYVDLTLINIELFQSWSKGLRLIQNLFSYKKNTL